MASEFFDMLTELHVSSAEAPVLIRDSEATGVVDEPVEPAQADKISYTRPYANEAANSRSAGALPAGQWDVRWRTELAGGLDPLFVLYAERAVLLQGPFQWQLFDTQGSPRAVGALGSGQTILDVEHGLFFGPGRTGVVTAWSLKDGKSQFSLLIATDDAFRQSLLARRNEQLLVLSVEDRAHPHGGHQPEESVLEVYDLGPTEPVDAIGLLKWARVQARLRLESPLLLGALHAETVVMASENRIFLADWGLKIITTFEETFIPLSMSLDEAGRIYLIVLQRREEEPERRALWVLTSDGQRLVDVTLPSAESDAYSPPVVGYDHQIYLFQGNYIVHVSAEGDLSERQFAGGPVAGGLATSDGLVIVAAGGLLSVYEAGREMRTLFALEDDRWVTPPVLTSEGRLLIASERHLYCLQVKS